MEEIKIGTTDRSITLFVLDGAQTDGSGKTGLVAANLTVSYTRVETDNDVVLVDATGSLSDLSALTDAHTDWGFKEVSSTLVPGLYRLDLADALFATGAWYATLYLMITTSAASAVRQEFKLISFDDTVKRLQKNTAFTAYMFVMHRTNGAVGSGLTVTARRSIDGGTIAACANAVVEVSDGIYKINLAATDLNGNNIVLVFTATNAQQLEEKVLTYP